MCLDLEVSAHSGFVFSYHPSQLIHWGPRMWGSDSVQMNPLQLRSLMGTYTTSDMSYLPWEAKPTLLLKLRALGVHWWIPTKSWVLPILEHMLRNMCFIFQLLLWGLAHMRVRPVVSWDTEWWSSHWQEANLRGKKLWEQAGQGRRQVRTQGCGNHLGDKQEQVWGASIAALPLSAISHATGCLPTTSRDNSLTQ